MGNRLLAGWRDLNSYLLLAALTLLCLVPFCEKAFHIDDTLFLRAAQQITKHPLDPYGFPVVWYMTAMPMSEVTMNPPIASYYIAGVARFAGWSETALHLAFLLPALVVVAGTYYLAGRFTRNPLLAAAATLLTPGFLVSSTNVMCDTMMLAAWMLAVIFWFEGLDREKPSLLALSAVLMAACTLTKYFGAALIPLLFVYTAARRRRAGSWMLFFVIPILLLAGYQHWTGSLYGTGLLTQAAAYPDGNETTWASRTAAALIGLSFAGGCAFPVIAFIPVAWSRRSILPGGFAAAAAAGLCCVVGAIRDFTLGDSYDWSCALQFGIFIAGGIFLFALAFGDWRKNRNADSVFLGLWVLGTFIFAAFVNWTVNARSVLPLIPAAGILLARRIDFIGVSRVRLIAPLAGSALLSIWVTFGDVRLANSERLAAQYVRDHYSDVEKVSFEGHWGFQYYMESFGFRPVDFDSYQIRTGNRIVLPENNSNLTAISPRQIGTQSTFSFDMNAGVTTTSSRMGAGFYAGVFGPLPYAVGAVPPERYKLVRLTGSGLLDIEDEN